SLTVTSCHGRFHGRIATLKNRTQGIITICLTLVLRGCAERETENQEYNNHQCAHFTCLSEFSDYPLMGKISTKGTNSRFEMFEEMIVDVISVYTNRRIPPYSDLLLRGNCCSELLSSYR